MNASYVTLVITLFLLSMICERVADYLKNFLSEANSGWGYAIRKFLKIGNLLTKAPTGSLEEQRRAYRILKINLFCGFITAIVMHANLFDIIKNKDAPDRVLGWGNVHWLCFCQWFDLSNIGAGLAFICGCLATGFFISFGSKFWHDMLDIIYLSKSVKRVLADPNTYNADNTETIEQSLNDYPSSYIKAAFYQAKSQYMAQANVKAVSLQSDTNGYYFAVTAKNPVPAIGTSFQYKLDNGRQMSVPVKITTLPDNQSILPHSIDLGNQVFNVNKPDDFGTVGCLVKDGTGNNFIMTCCHNVLHPITSYPVPPDSIQAGANNLSPIGPVHKMLWDQESDAALISLTASVFTQINNIIPGMGKPQQKRDLITDDINNLTVYVYGAMTKKNLSGSITGILTDVKIDYEGTEATLINLIVASNGGAAIAQKGDSGACVLDSNNKVVGLVVAGTDTETYIIPISTLLTRLSVNLV